MLKKQQFKGGLNLNFFDNLAHESSSDFNQSSRKSVARNVLRVLMMGWNQSVGKLVNWELLKAILVKRDPELLKEFRLGFQQGFDHVFTQLEGKQFTAEQHEQIQLYLSNCLTVFPIGDPNPYESLTMPQWIENQWVMVEYSVTPIELTNHKGKNEWIHKDYDRVFAYGLEPINNLEAQPHLIFMGTTYPAGQGFIPQITTDMKGFETVGYSLYQQARERLKQWIIEQKKKIHVCGISLGGSLSLLLAIDLGEYLSRVDALNPAGLHDVERGTDYDNWSQIEEKPEVVVQQQGDDWVSAFGYWKRDWYILKVTPEAEKKGPGAYFDHFLNYAGFADTLFTFDSPEEQNNARKTRNFWLYGLGRGIIYYLVLAPYSYWFRPIKNHVFGGWVNLSLSVLFLAVAATLFALTIWTSIPSLILVAAAAAVALIVGIIGVSCGVRDTKANNLEPGCRGTHHLEEFPNARQLNLAKLHHPTIPRNPELDVYKNDITFNLTYKEINTYYGMMRTLVKGKSFIPDKDKSSSDLMGSTKRELLLKSLDLQRAEQAVTLKTSKAKFMQIKHTLTLIDRIGVDNKAKLKEALEKEYHSYRLGKV